MPPKTAATPQPHMGRKIERIRTIKGIKQDALAKQLGITQGMLSRIEQSETVDDDKLKQIADALQMSVEAIKNFNEDSVVNFIQNNYDNATGGPQSNANATQNNHFNPVERMAELYERMLAEKDAEIKKLREMVKGK